MFFVQNMGFRMQQSEKKFFDNWLSVFKSIDPTKLDLNNPLDRKIYDFVVNKFGNLDIFDHTTNLFSDAELLLAERIINTLSKLFGRYGFQEMYQGAIFPKYGNFRFMAHRWHHFWDISGKRQIRNEIFSIGQKGFGTRLLPGYHADLDLKLHYYLSRFFSPYSVGLPTSRGIHYTHHNKGVLNDYWIPQILSLTDYDYNIKVLYARLRATKAHLSDFLSSVTQTQRISETDGRILLVSQLTKCLSLKGYSRSQFSAIMSGLRTKIFTSNVKSVVNIRLQLYDWLASGGAYTLTVKYGLSAQTISLTPSDYNFFFKPFVDIFSYSLKKATVLMEQSIQSQQQQAIQHLNLMQDFIIELLDFVKFISSEVGDKKIVLYPFTPSKDGVGYDNDKILRGNTYYPSLDRLRAVQGHLLPNAWNGELREWIIDIPYHGPSVRSYGLVFDPSDTSTFEELIPEFIGLALVEGAAFVVRILDDPNDPMNYDELIIGFDFLGGYMPLDLIRATGRTGPPSAGMKPADVVLYWELFNRINDITSKYDLLGLSQFQKDKSKFYEIFNPRFRVNNERLEPQITNYRYY